MSEAIKPTPGPCFVVGRAVHSDAVFCIGQFGHSFLNGNWSGSDFGSGMTEQVNQALRDYRQVCASARQREESASAVLAKLPPKPPEVK